MLFDVIMDHRPRSKSVSYEGGEDEDEGRPSPFFFIVFRTRE
jgi:hypothetical protein